MVPWKLLLAVVAGAVLIKELPEAGEVYDKVRAKVKSAVDRFSGDFSAEEDTGNSTE